MQKQSITELKRLFDNGEIAEDIVVELRKDERKGVQKLLKSYEKQKQKELELEKQFYEMLQFERSAINQGKQYIAGIDEAGRGPLAGPVVAAAVILPSDFKLLGLNDSKQLNETTREKYFTIIKESAISYGIAVIDSVMIDEINIFEATKLAMKQAVQKLNVVPDHILVDAVKLTGLPCTSEAIIKGDSKSISIAAASILAKVTRDHMMNEIHLEYPDYGFKANMGYGTKQHIEKLIELGPTPYHRQTFAPVKDIIWSKEG